MAEHAIHFWRKSSNTTVFNNTIEDSNRCISFRLDDAPNNQTKGGLITNKIIKNWNPSHQFTDVYINLEARPDIQIINNSVFIEGNYPNAIEHPFTATKNNLLKNNVTNKSIVSRGGVQADLSSNLLPGDV
jgi:hypothetical protein